MERYKVSRYNKFFDHEDGTHLAFNAMTGALATLTPENYINAQEILADTNKFIDDNNEYKELKNKLVYGGFLIKDDVDEIAIMKVRTRIRRFKTDSLGLTIAPTLECNFKCPYCYEQYKKGTMSDEVAQGLVDYLKERLKIVKHFDVTWYGGEPLLAWERIRKLTKEFKKNLSNS